MSDITDLAEKIKYYREETEKARREASLCDKVILLAATKTVDPERINAAVSSSGLEYIGENRVQELLGKYDSIENKEKLHIHFIGSLQSNKVKYIIDKVDLIESLDSERLAAEIDRQAKKIGRVMDVLIEVNIGSEAQKGGVMPDDVPAFAENVMKYTNINLRGLMTVAPVCGEPGKRREYFSRTYKLYSELRAKFTEKNDIDILSMGMTDSFRDAVLEGANLVRIGSGIFGSRQKPVVTETE